MLHDAHFKISFLTKCPYSAVGMQNWALTNKVAKRTILYAGLAPHEHNLPLSRAKFESVRREVLLEAATTTRLCQMPELRLEPYKAYNRDSCTVRSNEMLRAPVNISFAQ